jgi:hypothetical protein
VGWAADQKQKENHCKAAQATSHGAKTEMMKLIAESKFDLSDSALAGSGDDAVPVPGTTIHQFRLLDFVPEEMLKSAPSK